MLVPQILKDARFRCGRKLVTIGKADRAVDTFANLLDQARQAYGDDHIESAGPYYEYGNVLLRAFMKSKDTPEEEHPNEGDQKEEDAQKKASMRAAAAEAAEKRLLALSRKDSTKDEEEADKVPSMDKKPAAESAVADSQENVDKEEEDAPEKEVKTEDDAQPNEVKTEQAESEKEVKTEGNAPEQEVDDEEEEQEEDEDEDDPDLVLALEMMENAWSILDQYLSSSSPQPYKEWATEQFPRFLTGIGEVLSELGRHADAADVYSRAAQERQSQWQKLEPSSTEPTLEQLICRRRIAESYVLVAEEFLASPPDEDVVTSETESLLCKAGERVEYARGYYDKARDELQETVLLMGKLVAAKPTLDIEEEKENVCFASTLVMGVGTALAELDEQEAAAKHNDSKQPAKKKTKLN